MIKFKLSEELNKNYIVYGNFYNILYGGNEILPCRNVIEIYERNFYKSIENKINQYKNIPDAVFILMNPGSSSPMDKEMEEPVYELDNLQEKILKGNLVIAKPDSTQYQIMRIMDLKKWNHSRVINLSDIRDGNSSNFIRKVKEFENLTSSRIHSIFSYERKAERELAFNIKVSAPIILAWGTNNSLLPLANKCTNFIKDKVVKGLKHSQKANLYYHPCPSLKVDKEKWLSDMLNIL